jgi:hypothetical protein
MVLAVVVILVSIYVALFAEDRGLLITLLLSMAVGLLVGNFLVRVAFRRFGWGESAAKSLWVWSFVGGLPLILLVGFVLSDAMERPQPHLASIVFWLAFGVWIGAGNKAGVMRRQQRTEERP